MKHPTPEEWMDHLYGEAPPAEAARLEQHLETCAECRAQTAHWRHSMAALDHWRVPAGAPPVELPSRRVPGAVRRTAWQWAAAAVLMAGLAYGAGRWSAPGVDAAQIEARLQQSLRRQMQEQLAQHRADTRQMFLQWAGTLAEARQAEQQAVKAWLEDWAAQHQAGVAELRRDLETVAVMTEGTFRQTHDELSRLALLNAAEPPR